MLNAVHAIMAKTMKLENHDLIPSGRFSPVKTVSFCIVYQHTRHAFTSFFVFDFECIRRCRQGEVLWLFRVEHTVCGWDWVSWSGCGDSNRPVSVDLLITQDAGCCCEKFVLS